MNAANHLTATHLTTMHLTDDQIDEFLIGGLTPERQAHFEACELCQRRAAAFSSVVGSFNQATLFWAEAKSNTISRDLTAAKLRNAWRVFPASSLAGVLLIFVALFVPHRSSAPTPAETQQSARTAQAPGNQDSVNSIASDNALLVEIDSALYEQDASTLAPDMLDSHPFDPDTPSFRPTLNAPISSGR